MIMGDNKQNISVTVDNVIRRTTSDGPEVLLVKRKNDPYKGRWALPGGFVDTWERLKEAAARELKEETGIDAKNLEQVSVFDDPQRDPRGRTISIAFSGEAAPDSEARGKDDASEARWWKVGEIPDLAFDHFRILETVMQGD